MGAYLSDLGLGRGGRRCAGVNGAGSASLSTGQRLPIGKRNVVCHFLSSLIRKERRKERQKVEFLGCTRVAWQIGPAGQAAVDVDVLEQPQVMKRPGLQAELQQKHQRVGQDKKECTAERGKLVVCVK